MYIIICRYYREIRILLIQLLYDCIMIIIVFWEMKRRDFTRSFTRFSPIFPFEIKQNALCEIGGNKIGKFITAVKLIAARNLISIDSRRI